jgi:hypothetical protein
VQHYLIIDPDDRLVIHHARGCADVMSTRVLHSGSVTLDPPGLELAVADFYAS